MLKTPDIRLVHLSIDLDTVKKTVRLSSSGVSWLDPNKYPLAFDGREFELELLLSGNRSLRAPLTSFTASMNEPFGLFEKPKRGVVSSAVYTDEDAIGYRVWNRKTNELLGEEMLLVPKSPPKIEISGGLIRGLLVKVNRKVTSIVTLWSTDQGQIWQPLVSNGTTGEVAIPSRILPSESAVRTGGMLVEVRVMVGLKLYRERFQMDGAENSIKTGSWKRLLGEPPIIPQSALITTNQQQQ